MSRNRIIYQTDTLYVGPSPSTGFQQTSTNQSPLTRQLFRIQSCNYGYSLNRRDVNQYGELAAIDRILLESPTVNLDFSYLNNNFWNELSLGFYVNSGTGNAGNRSCISYILDKSQDDKNYHMKTTPEGVDSVNYGYTGEANIFFASIGNGFISNFSTEASVGDFPRTTVSVEGLNILFQQRLTGNAYAIDFTLSGMSTVANPAVNPFDGTAITNDQLAENRKRFVYIPAATSSLWSGHYFGGTNPYQEPPSVFQDPYSISALKPGDITLKILDAGTLNNLQEAGVLISDAKIQSYNLNFSLTRDPLQKLGSKYAFAREIRFPIQINLALEANVGDIFTGNLVQLITDDKTYDVEINIAHPRSGSFTLMKYILKNSKLDSQNFTSSIGPNKSVTLNFSSQIGGPLQFNKGLFFSGYLPYMTTDSNG